MKWRKLGLIFDARDKVPWAHSFALQPTPFLINDQVIRIYAGFRDKQGVSRVGFLDVAIDNPRHVLSISQLPVLDVGMPGTFDENGVVPCHVIRVGSKVHMYYAGYQLGQKVKFFVFGGLAISTDNGATFARYSRVPITDRTEDELFFRVIHSVIHEDGLFKVWYGAGNSFVVIGDKSYPSYNIRHMTSPDGITFGNHYQLSIDFADADEYRVARPWVVKEGSLYSMYFYLATRSKGFRLGYAESSDGISWRRKDNEIGIEYSHQGWDSEMIAYPSVLIGNRHVYMFYNGNNYGEEGIGCAELVER